MRRPARQTTPKIFYILFILIFIVIYTIFVPTLSNFREAPRSNNAKARNLLFKAHLMEEELIDDKTIFENNDKTDYEYTLRETKRICDKLCKKIQTPQLPTIDVVTTTEVKCSRLFGPTATELFDTLAISWPPPIRPPVSMFDDFSLNQEIEVNHELYLTERVEEGLASTWDESLVDSFKENAKSNEYPGKYGIQTTNEIKQFLSELLPSLKGAEVLVFGGVGEEDPWLEAILLLNGVKKITTLAFVPSPTDHPQIEAVRPLEFSRRYDFKELPIFDVAISISGIEHLGLGRYGEQINPYFDIIQVSRLSCVVKKKGLLIIGVPTRETDSLYWNAHRFYGPKRWPLLLHNWKPVAKKQCSDPLSHLLVAASNEREQ